MDNNEKLTLETEDIRNIDTHRWNVIPRDEFRELVRGVFNNAAYILQNTLGPFGATTFIEEYGTNHVTKDGWQLLKYINPENPTDRAILKLLKSIAHQVVVKVGDGSTTSIVASAELLRVIEQSGLLENISPRDLLNKINQTVDEITKEIKKNATEINKDGDLEEIRHLAYISTNGDNNIAEMIQKIYQETGNPAISFATSKTNQTKLEILNGYKIDFVTYIDRMFINTDDGLSVQHNPMILTFNHRIDEDYYNKIIAPLTNIATANGRKLVVIAPAYTNKLMEKLSVILYSQYNTTKTTESVFLRASLINNNSYDLYNDFAALCGSMVINDTLVKETLELESSEEIIEKAMSWVGSVEKMEVAEKYTFISGFTNKDDEMLDLLTKDAINKYETILSNTLEFETLTVDLIQAKDRVSKLKCKMGYIHVGGNSEIAKKANYDLVEDAVKACESAYKYGYNNGQNLAIIKASLNILKEMGEVDENNKDEMIKRVICNSIVDAFTGVILRIFANKYSRITQDDVKEILNRIKKCIDDNTAYDLYEEKYSTEIINSCMTDIEILKSVSSMVALLLSSNQMVSISRYSELN